MQLLRNILVKTHAVSEKGSRETFLCGEGRGPAGARRVPAPAAPKAVPALTELWSWAIISWDRWSRHRMVLLVTPFPMKDMAFPPRST